MPSELTSARITKFLTPDLQAAHVAAKKRVEALGLEYDALAGTRLDEFFLAVEVPKKWTPGTLADTAKEQLKLVEQLRPGRTLYFKDFDMLDQLLKSGDYPPPSLVSPLRTGAVKPLYQAGKLPTRVSVKAAEGVTLQPEQVLQSHEHNPRFAGGRPVFAGNP